MFVRSLRIAELRAGSYHPRPLRRVHIPTAGRPGKTLPLGTPTGSDGVAMAAARIVVEPDGGFEPGA